MEEVGKVKKSSMMTKRRSRLIFYCCGLALPLLQFAIFYIYINFNSFVLAFQKYDYDKGYIMYGAKNFIKLFNDFKTDPMFLFATKNSLLIFVIGFLFGTIGAVFFSYYIFKNLPGSTLFKVFLYLPNILGGIVIVIMFMYFAENAVPELVKLVTGKEIQGLLANTDIRQGVILFFCIWSGFGTSVLLYSSAMSGISDSILEAAQLDGITPLKELVLIVVPHIWNTFVTFAVSSVVGIFTNQMHLFTIYSESAPPDLYTFGYYMFRSIRMAGYTEYPYLAALGLMMTAVAVPITLTTRWAMNKYGPKDE